MLAHDAAQPRTIGNPLIAGEADAIAEAVSPIIASELRSGPGPGRADSQVDVFARTELRIQRMCQEDVARDEAGATPNHCLLCPRL